MIQKAAIVRSSAIAVSQNSSEINRGWENFRWLGRKFGIVAEIILKTFQNSIYAKVQLYFKHSNPQFANPQD